MEDDFTRLGLVDEEAIVLDEAALALALPDNPETDLDPYHSLLRLVASRLEAEAPHAKTAHERAGALSLVLNGEFGFIGDRETYDDSANADMIRVIDRRRGLPVSLSILYVAAARRLGWTANVLDLPGHVLVLIGDEADSAVIDPFRGGVLVQPEQIVSFLSASAQRGTKVVQVAAMPNRAILVRLLLNQATRAEDAGSDRAARPIHDRALRHSAGPPRHFTPFPKQDHRRDRPDSIAAGDGLLGFGIERPKPHPRLELPGGSLERGRHLPAWAAP